VQSDRATLELTTQRYASRVLFVIGGAALGGSLVLSALAKRAENSAEQFLVNQSRRNVTGSELSQYTDSVTERDRWRAVSIVSLASSGLLFVTGFALYEFDNPSRTSSQRTVAPLKQALSSTMVERLRLVPQIAGAAGLWVQGEF
jgi:hypothetical protein